MNKNNPKTFVLILSYNGKQWLTDCVPSVLAMDYSNYEVVVIDNGSSDGTEEYIKSQFPEVHLLELQPNVGYSKGFNAGLEYAARLGADYFLIMNNDTVIDAGALSALMETALSHEKAGFVTGKIFYYDEPNVFQTVGKKEDPIQWNGDHIGIGETDIGQYDTEAERPFIDDVMTLVNRAMYAQIGGYDPQLFLQAEEFDWQVRAKKKGWQCYYTPKAKLWHRVSMTIGASTGATARYFDTRSRIVVMARHANFSKFLVFYLCTGFRATDSLLRGLLQLNPAKIKPRLAMLLGFVTGTFWLIHKRPPKKTPRLIVKLH